jgi:hypothetical protein
MLLLLLGTVLAQEPSDTIAGVSLGARIDRTQWTCDSATYCLKTGELLGAEVEIMINLCQGRISSIAATRHWFFVASSSDLPSPGFTHLPGFTFVVTPTPSPTTAMSWIDSVSAAHMRQNWTVLTPDNMPENTVFVFSKGDIRRGMMVSVGDHRASVSLYTVGGRCDAGI